MSSIAAPLKPKRLAFIRTFIRELFFYSFITWFFLSLLEMIWPKIVLAYFNLNYLLFLSFLAGFLGLAWPETTPKAKKL